MNPNQINAEVCKALGLEGMRVTKIVLTFEAGEMPTIQVTRYTDAALADGLSTAIEVLKLKPAP